jgi:putative spermidine/putrescine transport system substrate-binding protein
MKKKHLGILMIALLVGFFSSSAFGVELVLNFSGGAAGDAVKKFYIEPFEKATGHKIIFEAGANFAKLRAMVKSGNVEWDLAEATSQDLIILGAKEGILEPIDYTVVSKAGIYQEALHPYGVGKAFYSTVLAYNGEKYPKGKHPKGWKDFWDGVNFPGPKTLQNDPFNNLEFALMADGVPPDKIYPLDLDRAFRSLDKIKPLIKVWWTAGAQPAQLLTDKETDMVSAWNGRIYAIQKQGAKVEIEWNQGMLQFSNWVVPKGAKNKKVAMEFINFTHQPKLQAAYAEFVGYPGLSQEAFKFIKPEFAPNLPTYPEHYKRQVVVNYQWWHENREKVQERWNAWIMKK